MGSSKSEVSFFSIEGAINAKSVMSKSSTPKNAPCSLTSWASLAATNPPNENPPIHSLRASVWLWIHWSTVNASSISPVTLPYSPVDWPTPRKLKRTTCMFWSRAKRYMVVTTLFIIVPSCNGLGWQRMATRSTDAAFGLATPVESACQSASTSSLPQGASINCEWVNEWAGERIIVLI